MPREREEKDKKGLQKSGKEQKQKNLKSEQELEENVELALRPNQSKPNPSSQRPVKIFLIFHFPNFFKSFTIRFSPPLLYTEKKKSCVGSGHRCGGSGVHGRCVARSEVVGAWCSNLISNQVY